jgi:hypothetical protein
MSSDWKLLPGDTLYVDLWFEIDAGTSIKLWADSTGVRGWGTSSGWMGPGGHAKPTVLYDSVSARRIGEAEPQRCVG